MDFIANADLLSKLLATLVVLMTAVFGFFRWVRPKVKKVASEYEAGRDALIGRPAVYDSITGKELSPALPGMGVRQAETEMQVKLQREQLGELTAAMTLLANNDQRTTDLEHRVTALEGAAVERVAGKVESTAAWRAVEAIAQTPAEPLVEHHEHTHEHRNVSGIGEN